MTVIELIAKLAMLPPEAKVIFSRFSEYTELEEDEIEVRTPETNDKVILRNNNYLRFYAPDWDEREDGPAKFQTVVIFPGN